MEVIDQECSADRVDQQRAAADRPTLEVGAVAVTADLYADHPRAKGFVEILAITWLVAEICHDQGIRCHIGGRLRRAALARALPNLPCGSSWKALMPTMTIGTG